MVLIITRNIRNLGQNKGFAHFVVRYIFIQSDPFSDTLTAILKLTGGGDSVGANERRMAIWHTLCYRRHVTISYLAAEYKVSRSTIRDDVDILSLSYPIVSVRGHGGGIKVADWYQPKSMLLTPVQMDLLLKISKQLSGDEARIMSSIIILLTSDS